MIVGGRRWCWIVIREMTASTAPVGRGGEGVAAVEVALTDGVRVRFIDAPVSMVVEVVSRLRRC